MANSFVIEWVTKADVALQNVLANIAAFSSPQKANQFITELNIKLKVLEKYPDFYAPCPHGIPKEFGIKCIRFKKYLLPYIIQQNTKVIILGIVHSRQNPNAIDEFF